MKESSIKSYLPHAIGATLLVAGVPALVMIWLESSGRLPSTLLSLWLGISLSLGASLLGSALWMRHSGSQDIVFGDLMIWGWVRRARMEKHLMESRRLLAGSSGTPIRDGISPERQIEILEKLASALEAGDPYTHGHSRRVAGHASMIAKTMGLSGRDIAMVRTAAAVHDVGKLYVSSDVLNKPGKLTDEEYEQIKLHSVKSAEMIGATGDQQLIAIVRHHHERIDGTGYPDELAGEEIPLGARIIAVADTFDAITSSRSYRAASKHKKAVEILKKEAGRQLDARSVEAFLSYYSGRSSFAWWLALTTAPQRLLGHLIGWFERAGASALANTAAVSGKLALVTGTIMLGGTTMDHVAVARVEQGAAHKRPVASTQADGEGVATQLVGGGQGSEASTTRRTSTKGHSRKDEPGSKRARPASRKRDSSKENRADGDGDNAADSTRSRRAGDEPARDKPKPDKPKPDKPKPDKPKPEPVEPKPVAPKPNGNHGHRGEGNQGNGRGNSARVASGRPQAKLSKPPVRSR